MLRLRFNPRRVHRLRRAFSSAPPPSHSHLDTSTNLNKPHLPSSPPSQSAQGPLSPIYITVANSPPSSSLTRKSVFALSAVVLSAAVASAAIFSVADDQSDGDRVHNRVYESVEHAIQKSGDSFRRVVHHARQTGVAASILWQSLTSVLSSANHEVRVGFELRVAALLADIASTNVGRRAALVAAGRGAVVDWLLETVAAPGERVGTQDEAARALAYLIADPNVSKEALRRPKAVPNLLKFIFSCQPKTKKHPRRSSFNISDSLKGRSMLVAAIMDIVTSNCENVEKMAFNPSLPGNAEMRDIAAAIQVIEEGGIYFDDPNKSDDNDDGRGGMRGIGIKILEGTTVLGLSRTTGLMALHHPDADTVEETPKTLALLSKHDNSQAQANLSSAVIPGLWDDLHCQHVAVPFAAWALANWAMASHTNRSHIQELDHDGKVVMTALMAPERTVKWHGSLVARLLLEDPKLQLNDSVSDWSSSLLATVSHATKNDDISLAQVALSAFLVSVDRSEGAQKIVMEKGLYLLRDSAKRTRKHKMLQEGLAKALELLCSGDMHLSLEESQKWSDILLSWVLGKVASDTIQYSATKILSRILEDYGPFCVSISQGWLALIMNEIVNSSKTSSAKGAVSPKNDNMKIQSDQSNVVSATQSTNQLAGAVVNLATAQLGTVTDSIDTFPLADLLSLEPFAGSFKSLKKDSLPKFNTADSAFATLKAIKSLTEFCGEDSVCQSKIVDFGVLCLLRRFLLCDDYEKLAAIEAYDASRALEAQERVSDSHTESAVTDTHDPSSVRVPASAHIRRHAARLLTILSLLPQVQEAIIADETWCKWLGDCAGGKIPGCNDLKIQSYAKASLLNVFCNHQDGSDSGNDSIQKSDTKSNCPRFGDKIFLVNPGLPHWKCPEMVHQNGEKKESSSSDTESTDIGDEYGDTSSNSSLSGYVDSSDSGSLMHAPEFDVIFVHGLRGGPYKTWRIAEDKSSTKSGLVEKIDQEAGKMGSFWPGEWLSDDFPQARLLTLKYKTNLTQWSGDTLPLQEVSSMLLEKLLAAGIGDRPVVFVTHSMGGLVVKQILHKAKAGNNDKLVNNTVGIVFYSCPHFGSKLADMPWRMGLVLRPAPSIGELRSGSPRLVELNDFIRQLHKKRILEVLSLCETKVTPIVEGYGGWAFRMEIVPIESAYPGFGELVVLESTDHINSCKPVNRSDPSYAEILKFLHKLRAQHQRS